RRRLRSQRRQPLGRYSGLPQSLATGSPKRQPLHSSARMAQARFHWRLSSSIRMVTGSPVEPEVFFVYRSAGAKRFESRSVAFLRRSALVRTGTHWKSLKLWILAGSMLSRSKSRRESGAEEESGLQG